MTAAQRIVPSTAAGSTLPYVDAKGWQDKVHTEIAALWRYIGAPLTGIGGTANAITASSDTAVVAALTAGYATGMKFGFTPTANNSAAVTINIDTQGNKNVKDADGTALTTGALISGRRYLIEYDGTDFRIISGGNLAANNNGQEFISGAFQKLQITNNAGTPNTKIDVTADGITVSTTGGVTYRATSVSQTIDLGITGANGLDTGAIAADTWYYIFEIYNPGSATAAALASTSSTAPTMPSGYTAKARIGAMRTNGSSQLYRTLQYGRRAQYIIGTNPTAVRNVANGTAGTYSATSPTLTNVSISTFVPSTAAAISLLGTNNWKGVTAVNVLIAPNTSWGGANNGPQGSAGQIYPYWGVSTGNFENAFWLLLESTNIAWCSSGATGAVSCLGWEDNL